jgi:zinc-ribbon domain
MFCRYCGAHILDDSLFCAKCGKRLGLREYPRWNKIVQTFHLKTPYPYFVIFLAAFLIWAVAPRRPHVDTSMLKWSFEMDRELNVPEQNHFQQSLSLVVENTGTASVSEVPIELRATIEPAKPAEVVAGFLGRKLVIMRQGRPLPLVIVLANELEPGQKKRFLLEGSIQAEPPFKVTYEVREEDSIAVLASHVIEEP